MRQLHGGTQAGLAVHDLGHLVLHGLQLAGCAKGTNVLHLGRVQRFAACNARGVEVAQRALFAVAFLQGSAALASGNQRQHAALFFHGNGGGTGAVRREDAHLPQQLRRIRRLLDGSRERRHIECAMREDVQIGHVLCLVLSARLSAPQCPRRPTGPARRFSGVWSCLQAKPAHARPLRHRGR